MPLNRESRRALNEAMKALPEVGAVNVGRIARPADNRSEEWRRSRVENGWARYFQSGDRVFYVDCVVDWAADPLPEYLPTVIYPQHFEVWEGDDHLSDFDSLGEAVEFIKGLGGA